MRSLLLHENEVIINYPRKRERGIRDAQEQWPPEYETDYG